MLPGSVEPKGRRNRDVGFGALTCARRVATKRALVPSRRVGFSTRYRAGPYAPRTAALVIQHRRQTWSAYKQPLISRWK